jgi:eukaryotic-like serine/threonine-protein kinase
MPSKVTLKVVQGELSEREFVFEERTTCLIGRDGDCNPRIPNDAAHKTISRHHCLLDINPPDVRVRDFGSLNGTYVNGKRIGRRERGQTPEQAAQVRYPEYDLKDGDEIRLQATVFKVAVFVPTTCSKCAVEIPEAEKSAARIADKVHVCTSCRKKREPPPAKAPVPRCAKCGCDVSAEVGDNRRGDCVCLSCRADPFELLKQLLGRADQGDQSLIAVQGYAVLKELGRGGMGAVYLARHEKTGEQVALKVMLPRVAVEERAKAMFLRETANTRALRHRHVVELRDSGCSWGTFFFTLEFCDGGSVDRLMALRGGKLSVDEAVSIVLQALDGLIYAHQADIRQVKLSDGSTANARGIVHRDLSPNNLFLSGSGSSRIAKVADFGLAKAFDTAGLSGQTSTGMAAGKPYFMPRQQVVNFKFAMPEVDVWAMAASLYQMLTGRFVPRDFPRDQDPWAVVLNTAAVPIRRRDPSIPARLAEVIDYALIDKPEIKVKTAAQFKKMLTEAV